MADQEHHTKDLVVAHDDRGSVEAGQGTGQGRPSRVITCAYMHTRAAIA